MSNATEQLRAELDERGVEWRAPTSFDGAARYNTTTDSYWFHEYNGKITIHGLTPAQAIEATLGPRKCMDLGGGPDEFGEWYFVCSGCKCEFGYDSFACEFADGNDIGKPHYCPNCGAKVIESE